MPLSRPPSLGRVWPGRPPCPSNRPHIHAENTTPEMVHASCLLPACACVAGSHHVALQPPCAAVYVQPAEQESCVASSCRACRCRPFDLYTQLHMLLVCKERKGSMGSRRAAALVKLGRSTSGSTTRTRRARRTHKEEESYLWCCRDNKQLRATEAQSLLPFASSVLPVAGKGRSRAHGGRGALAHV